MKILFLSLFLPYPEADHASAFSDFNLLRHLSSRHEITLLTFVRSAAEQAYAGSLREFCTRVETVFLPKGAGGKLRSRLALFSATPIAIAQAYSREMACKVRSLCRNDRFDVLHVEYTSMGQYLAGGAFNCPVRALNVHDLIGPQMRNRAAHLPFSRRKLEYWVDAVLARAYEARLCSRFDVVLAASRRIQSELERARTGLRVTYFPPGVELCPKPREHLDQGKQLIFLGAMWREENIDAVLWFYHHVFQQVCAEVPEATLLVIGGSPGEQVRNLSGDPRVRVTGYIKELLPWYLASDVSIAPVRIAGGVLCKILDAMASGLPVITTSFGNDGVGASPPEEIIVADQPEDFATNTARLLKNARLRTEISRRGLEFIRRNFSWPSIVSSLEQTYDRHRAQRGGKQPVSAL